jgi:RND family efflux transporter MFP subunit
MHKYLLFLTFIILISSCGKSDDDDTKNSQVRDIYVTTEKSKIIEFSFKESAVGSIEGIIDPTVASEVSGQITKIYVRPGTSVFVGDILAEIDPSETSYQLSLTKAEVKKFKARLSNQKINYDRNLKLVEQDFISPNALETLEVEIEETEEELNSAIARLEIAKLNNNRTKIFAPIAGKIEKQIISIGDFVKIGDPLYQIINNKKLRAHIPFPERFADLLKPGIEIKLKTPTSDDVYISKIAELKPQIIADSRSIDIIADIEKQPSWQAGASVKGTIIFEKRSSVAVPEQSVVLRPLGTFVYESKNNKAIAKKVTTGITQEGWIEIIDGISEGTDIVIDGAGYLTNDANIKIKQNDPA